MRDNQVISACFEDLMNAASQTADVYMTAAIRNIDTHFGDGFAKTNPSLIGAFMQTAALDFLSSSLVIAAQKIRDGSTTP